MNKDLEKVFELSKDPVICLDNNKVCYANAAAKKLFGEDLTGHAAFAPLPKQIASITGGSFTCSVVINGKACNINAARCFDMLVLYITVEEAKTTEYGFISDILINSIMSSMFNVSLTIDLLRDENKAISGKEALRRYTPMLTHSYCSLKRLLGNLCAAYSLSSGKPIFLPKPTDLAVLCSNIASTTSVLMKGQAEINFSTELGQLYANIDSEKIERILLNLINNSFNSISGNGKIQITLREDSNNAVITVTDNGKGISPDIMPTLFCRYKYAEMTDLTSLPGAGLGLYISKGFAQLHGGSLIAESKEGAGTSMHLVLPLEDDRDNIFRDHDEPYEVHSMDIILTELAEHLDKSIYGVNFSD